MKWLINIIGVILILMGLVWILQGVNVLGGSMMSGHIQYAYLGIGLDIIGAGLLAWANRRARAPRA